MCSIVLLAFMVTLEAGRGQAVIPVPQVGFPLNPGRGSPLKGRYIGRQNALSPGSRRGRGGAGWGGAPCGCPCCPHLCAHLQTSPRAATRAPSPTRIAPPLKVLTINLPLKAGKIPCTPIV